jgi:hypothetical protein
VPRQNEYHDTVILVFDICIRLLQDSANILG